MNDAQQRTIRWLANGETGTSSKAMAFWLAFGERMDDTYNYPHDPADFDRCLRLLTQVPEMRAQLPRMAEVGPEWAALVGRWDEIEACHLDEVGLGWSKARRAPRTYELMSSIIRPIEKRS